MSQEIIFILLVVWSVVSLSIAGYGLHKLKGSIYGLGVVMLIGPFLLTFLWGFAGIWV